jgi:uncharacterized membrane protein YjgN (DUF898 family)
MQQPGGTMQLSFRLKGSDWIGLYLAAFVFYVGPLLAIQFVANNMERDPKNLTNLVWFFCLFALSMLSLLILATPILSRIVGGIRLGDTSLKYSGKTAGFVFLNIGNLLLSMVTLGIYFPWYLTRLWRYLVGRTSCGDQNFAFRGKGLHLLGILFATLVPPMVVYLIAVALLGKLMSGKVLVVVISQTILILLMIPYIYWVYKWTINIAYKGYLIRWETSAMESMAKILVEMLLTIVTIGIYYPVAITKLYQYFIARTVVTREGAKVYTFDAKFNYLSAWKTVWAQVILTIITCGIYGAWAYCKIANLFIGNTSLVKYGEPSA